MRALTNFIARALRVSLAGCRRGSPTAATPAAAAGGRVKPFAVTANDGIDHEFYRSVSLQDFLKQLPSGSVDSLDLDVGGGPCVCALVRVSDRAGADLTKVRFETKFTAHDGQVVSKSWAAAKGKQDGKVVALFSFPFSIVSGETKIVQSEGE